MTNSKRKGKTGELELAGILKKMGYKVRRSVQYNGRAPGGQADLIGLPGIHVEVKRVQSGFTAVHNAMDQAIRDSADTFETPAVFHRQNRKPWLVTMRLEDWLAMYGAAEVSAAAIDKMILEGEHAEEEK